MDPAEYDGRKGAEDGVLGPGSITEAVMDFSNEVLEEEDARDFGMLASPRSSSSALS